MGVSLADFGRAPPPTSPNVPILTYIFLIKSPGQTVIGTAPVEFMIHLISDFHSVRHYPLDTLHWQPMLNGPVGWPSEFIAKLSRIFWVGLDGTGCKILQENFSHFTAEIQRNVTNMMELTIRKG